MDRVELEDGVSEGVGSEELLSVGVLSSLLPVAGSELEDAGTGPAGEQAQDVSEVGFGLDVVHVAAGDERGEGGVDLGAVVASDEQPVGAANSLFRKNYCRSPMTAS